jgi:2-C-methyl-D-erythritol 2,4-cyclodiphosphate synthase
LKLLKKVNDLAREAGYQICNVDAVILAEAPNLKAFKPVMRVTIAAQLNIAEQAVNIKATTNEGLGFVGRREGIAAYATVLLQRKDGNPLRMQSDPNPMFT